jgi:hypothetical protein
MTKTLIDAVNELLLVIGELPVTNLSSPVARKAVIAINRAASQVGQHHRWTFLRATTGVTAVPGDAGAYTILFPSSRILAVYLPGNVLQEQPPLSLLQQAKQVPATGVPRYWSRVTETLLRIYPAMLPAAVPTATVLYLGLISEMFVATDTLTVPDDVYYCIQTYAEMTMHRIHTADMNALQAATLEYENKLQYARTKDGVNGWTM